MTSEKLLREAEEIRDRVLSARRTLHQSPGTGFDIGETLAFVRKELADMGYTVAISRGDSPMMKKQNH